MSRRHGSEGRGRGVWGVEDAVALSVSVGGVGWRGGATRVTSGEIVETVRTTNRIELGRWVGKIYRQRLDLQLLLNLSLSERSLSNCVKMFWKAQYRPETRNMSNLDCRDSAHFLENLPRIGLMIRSKMNIKLLRKRKIYIELLHYGEG